MATIQSIKAREIRDSRGNPTIEAELKTSSAKASASVPSGASVGAHEAHELRDGVGRGVSMAIMQIHETIALAVAGKEFDQKGLDTYLCELDGTADKSRLGANAILAVSIAFARAQAMEEGKELYAYLGSLDDRNTFRMPQPLFNVLNGGKHTPHGIDIQECMLTPLGFAGIRESVDAVKKCMRTLQSILEKKRYETLMGDEGGFAPALRTNEEALEILALSIEQSGYAPENMRIALDIAASSFYTNGRYMLKSGGENREMNREQLLSWYTDLAQKYPLISIEDPFAEDDWDGFTAIMKELGGNMLIVGDDLTVTNTERIRTAVEKKAVNSCIIKPNQIGTVTEAIEAVRSARNNGWKIFASHRSGETMDSFIADFAVGLSCEYLKAGAPTKDERLVKYNRLMEIEGQLSAV